MDGYLLINKPTGISSFGVVARVRRVLSETSGRKLRVGHTGTLDPEASGLMILVVGKYTKRASEFSKLDKTYEVEAMLGATSSTGDREGVVVPKSTQQPSLEEIQMTLNNFLGTSAQTPPIYSAVKVGGQRAYKLARAGKRVKIEPRQVSIRWIENIEYNYPKLSFVTEVSSGTYIRSLVEDVGQELGTGAYMSALKRTKVGNHNLAEALPLESLNAEVVQNRLKQLPNHP